VAHGPAGENGLAHLGLSARSAETGEGRPWSLAAAAADSGDPTTWNRGEKVWEYHNAVVSRFGGGGVRGREGLTRGLCNSDGGLKGMTGGTSSVSGPIPSVGRSVSYSVSPWNLGKRRWLRSFAGDG
jgi:hypothetical protein